MKTSKKHSPKFATPRRIPHVLLLVETSGILGRGIIEGIGRYVAENGPWSIQYEYRALDTMPPKWLKDWKGDGIITRTFNPQQARVLQSTRLPRVELLGMPKYGIAEVRGDFSGEARLAVDHFWNRGLRNFAYFAGGDAWWIRENIECFSRVLGERGYSCEVYHDPICGQDMRSWNESYVPNLKQWLGDLPHPVGILTPGDIYAVHLLTICREMGLAVPEEIAIIGRGNDPVICNTVRPTLSSLELDVRRIGYEAARTLDMKMAGEKVPDVVYIPPIHVATRQSTDLMILEDADLVQAMQFIRNFACKGIEVPDVAEHVGISRRVLERRFLHYLGRTPKAEIMRVRIEHAKMLLAKTDRLRDSISQRCGFNSPQYFSKVFHRLVGIRAQDYRKMSRISRDPGME
jgi:LacI family transcriptional regulator